LIRRTDLSRLDRVVAAAIGVSVIAVGVLGLVAAVTRWRFPLLLAAIGGVIVGVLFIVAAVTGRPQDWQEPTSRRGSHRRSKNV
jgi:uncharacterized membrane protein